MQARENSALKYGVRLLLGVARKRDILNNGTAKYATEIYSRTVVVSIASFSLLRGTRSAKWHPNVLPYQLPMICYAAIINLSEYRQQRRRKDGHKLVTNEETAAPLTCRKSLKIMVSRGGLEPPTR
jgi:hypothetical protein